MELSPTLICHQHHQTSAGHLQNCIYPAAPNLPWPVSPVEPGQWSVLVACLPKKAAGGKTDVVGEGERKQEVDPSPRVRNVGDSDCRSLLPWLVISKRDCSRDWNTWWSEGTLQWWRPAFKILLQIRQGRKLKIGFPAYWLLRGGGEMSPDGCFMRKSWSSWST